MKGITKEIEEMEELLSEVKMENYKILKNNKAAVTRARGYLGNIRKLALSCRASLIADKTNNQTN
jgi:hypothetical protein